MKKLNYFLLVFAIAVITASCGKDGAVGPQGDTGDKGLVGPAGPTGADGKAGSVIYSGNTVPAASKGVIGDFYLNTATDLLYGPKTADGWGSGFSLKGANGAAGATGAAGSTTLSGAGAPALSLGKTGDYYLDKTNYLLYGPKTASSWGVPVNLRGPAGPQGPPGNANVKVDTFTVKSTDWLFPNSFATALGSGGTTLYYTTKYFVRNNALITQSVLNTGMVLVYYQSAPGANANSWQTLPFTIAYPPNYSYNWVSETSVGKVTLHFYFSTINSTPPVLSTYVLPTAKYKIVVVTGTLISSMRQNRININNYNEVSKALHLVD